MPDDNARCYGDAYDGSFEQMFEELFAENHDIMVQRQIKYGPKNIPEFGAFGTLVRMADKFARLKNLMINGRGGLASDESLEDTLIDIANYATIMRAQERGWWTVDRCPKLAEDID